MTVDHRESRFDERAHRGVAFLASLIVHTSLLIFLACYVFTFGVSSEGLLLTARIQSSHDREVVIIPEFDVPEEDAVASSQSAEPPVQLMSVEVATPGKEKAAERELLKPLLEDLRRTDKIVLPVAMRNDDATDDKQVASHEHPTDGQTSSTTGAHFFGTYAEGKRFVYVLDSSTSMREGDRWVYACHQLIDSLNALQRDQEFFVICFDNQTKFLLNSQPKYFWASSRNVDKVQNWLRSVKLGNDTRPMNALFVALQLKPDAIFLLTDGRLRDASQQWLSVNNGVNHNRIVPVHTFYLSNDPGQKLTDGQAKKLSLARQTLQSIAATSGGTFRVVECRRTFRADRKR